MKKTGLSLIIIVCVILLAACNSSDKVETTTHTTVQELTPVDEAILTEMQGSFNFFWEAANTDKLSPGYGLVRDRYPGSPNLASIASVGFGLTAIPVGVENGWITREEGEERALGTLKTFENMVHIEGFYYHFVTLNTGVRAGTSEISVIDTGLFIAGAILVGEYFGGVVKEKAELLYERVNWNWYIDPTRNMFYMGYYPDQTPNFRGHWDFYAEQLILYVLGAGAPKEEYRIDQSVYYTFNRRIASYGGGEPIINSWFGSLFTYQYSHSWVDFRNIEDKNGVNWFENSVNATIANRQYAIDTKNIFKTFGENSWGMTASDGPKGYSGLYGSKPSGFSDDAHKNDGTIPPSGAIGSIVFLPDQVKNAIMYFETIEGLKGRYGYKDAYNFESSTPWIAKDVIGINKGVTLLMLQNYQNELIWDYFMRNEYVQNGLEYLEFKVTE
ncbi:MAG: hypothetical protein K0Q49_1033 [Haloplasmataceae bacterium]|jgi:hypothetical protein|nr:hypothetical protein [Haloplasmataceae bacterium]